jgi:hypothetical protein
MSGVTPPTAAIVRAYRQSCYTADGMVAKVGRLPEGLHPDLNRNLVLLGACNPGGRKRPDGWNTRMMDRLRAVLRRFHFVEARGSLHLWSEEMLLVQMNACQAMVIARRFRQNAIIVISRRRRTRLLLLSERITNVAGSSPCSSRQFELRVAEHGWR